MDKKYIPEIEPEDFLDEEDLDNWDKVRCKVCGEIVSILEAKLVDETYFVHQSCLENLDE
jgi:hypothetical protein